MASPESQAIATKVILNLTGRRWTWPRKRVVEEYQVAMSVSSITLVGRPVSGVNSVVDRLGNAYTFQLSDGFRLRLPSLEYSYYGLNTYASYDTNGGIYLGQNWNRWGLFLTVDYVYGSPPPLDVQRAIDELATELDLAAKGQDCKLPQRVTSMAREGITLTVLDPAQFLVGGKTGLYFPDLVISAYGVGKGGRVMARTKVYSAEYAPPRRLSSVTLSQDVNVVPPETGENSVPIFPWTNEYARGIDIGADWTITVTAPTATEIDTVSAQVRDSLGTLILDFESAGGGNGQTNINGNVITLLLASTDTQALTAGNYVYDLFANVDGVRRKLVQGTVDINAAVTGP